MNSNKLSGVDVKEAVRSRLKADQGLKPYKESIQRRIKQAIDTEHRIAGRQIGLSDFASGHEYFGMHHRNDRWIFREWAPNASGIFLKGDFSKWRAQGEFSLSRVSDDGVWEIELPGDLLRHKDEYRLEMHWPGRFGDRIPAWTRRVVQDPATSSFNAQIWRPDPPYQWKHSAPTSPNEPFFIYETHVGMGTEDEKTGTYDEFRETVLPRIRDAGYGAIQIMALAEHPYYASFGYQVSNFFACSSRYGTPEALKRLVDAAHGMGILVLMDLVHSHAVKNEVEGISRFDGTPYQFFHGGERGNHPAWDSKCFDY